MGPPPIPLVRAGPSRSDGLLSLFALATRICRLASEIDRIDGSTHRPHTVRPSVASSASSPICDFLCPRAASAALIQRFERLPSPSGSRYEVTPTTRIGLFTTRTARVQPASPRSQQARYASSAAAATKAVDSSQHVDHQPSYSSYTFTPATDMPLLPSQDTIAPSGPKKPLIHLPHWLSSWKRPPLCEEDANQLDRLFQEEFAKQRAEFAPGWEERTHLNGITLRRVAAHRLWRLYRQHAHKQTLSLHTRLSIADSLVHLVNRVTTNKSDSASSKALRYLFGRRINAIWQDCLVLMKRTRPSASHTSKAMQSHVGLLEPISLALQSKPISALKMMDTVLLHRRPDIYRSKNDRKTPSSFLSPIDLTLRTIVDSLNFEIHCRPDAEDVTQRIKSQSEFFEDDDMLVDLIQRKIVLHESEHPTKESLDWFAASQHAFLLSHKAFRNARISFLKYLSQTKDPHQILDQLAQKYDAEEPGFVQACDLLFRSILRHKGSEAALELYDDLWSRGVPMSSSLIQKLIDASSGQGLTRRLETLLHRVRHATVQGQVSTRLLRSAAKSWAKRNRADRVEILLSHLRRRKKNGHDRFERVVMMELHAAQGDLPLLHEKLAEVHDFEARHIDHCVAGKKPLNGTAYGLLIKACNRIDDILTAEHYLTQALERGLALRSSDFNLLIDMHIRKTNVDAALAIFDQMKEFGVSPDKYTYTILIHGFALRRDPDSAAHALRAMTAADIMPDRVTYAALLNCFVESGLYSAAIRLFAWMQDQQDVRLRPTIEVCNVILKAYVLSSLPVQKIMQFVSNMRKVGLEPNANTYALMLQSASDAGLMDIAEEVFSEAERALPHLTGAGRNQGANLYHFTIMIQGYLRIGEHTEAKEYFNEMRLRKLEPSAITWNVMVQSYANSENEVNYDLATTLVSQLIADESKKAFRPSSWNIPASKQQERSGNVTALRQGPPFESLYTVLMVAQARRGEPERVEKTLDKLSRHTPGLSIYAMVPLLDAYRRVGDVDRALDLFERIYESALEDVSSKKQRVYAYSSSEMNKATTEKSKFEVSTQRRQDASSRNLLCLPVSIMIELLSDAGRHEEIARIWSRAKNDGFGFDSDNWNHLAASMARAGQLEEALSVVEHVLYRDPPNAWMRTRFEREPRKPDIEAESDTLAARERDNGQAESANDSEFDPLPPSTALDPAVSHRPDAASPPSRPPNRRHQNRLDDDPYLELPFERPDDPEPMLSAGEEETDFERPPSKPVEQDEDFSEPGAFYLDSNSGNSLTRDLESKATNSFSPWWAHFETMEAISRGLADMRKAQKVIALLDKYRTAAGLLDLHERKVEIIRERQKEEAVRSARDLIDGRA